MSETQFYLPQFFTAEYEFAAYLAKLMRSGCQKIDPVFDGLDKDQPKAVQLACERPVSIICGGPGTGKTTTTRRACDSFQKAGLKVRIMCPTAKAAKRSDEVVNAGRTDKIEASTIHLGLEYNVQLGGFKKNSRNQLDCDVLLIDEFSMLDIQLGAAVLSSVNPKRTRVVFCGDWHQLPSVGPGCVARDMIMSGVIPKTELNHVFRTGPNSGIAYNANRILNGEEICKQDPRTGEDFTDFYFVPKTEERLSMEFILENICTKIPKKLGYDPLLDIQCLSPGKKSIVGTDNLNKMLRDKLNPNKGKGFHGFYEGDKIACRANKYEHGIVNGDVGKILRITDENVEAQFTEGCGQLGDGYVCMPQDEFDDMRLAYCNTIHTSQGSEYKAVLIPIHRTHYRLLFRELLYTGITRARELAVVIGDISAFNHCIANNVSEKRNTNLQSILRRFCGNIAA